MKRLVLALALTALATGAAAETYGLKAAKVALSGKSQAVIVAVPRSFVRADPRPDDAKALVAGDWSYEFLEWRTRYKDRSNVVVLYDAPLSQLFKSPAFEAPCTTLFIKDAAHGLAYDASCAPKAAVYDAGAAWLQTGAAPDPALGMRPVDLKRR